MPPASEGDEEPLFDGTFPPTAQNGGGRGARPDFTGTWDSTSVENLDAFLEARGVPYLKRIVGVQLQQSVTQVLRHSADGVELVQTSVSRLSTFTQVQRCGEMLTADDPTGGTVRLTARWDGDVWQVDSRAASGLPPVFLSRWLDGDGRMWFRMQTTRPGGGPQVAALRCFTRRPGTAAPVLTPLHAPPPPPPPLPLPAKEGFEEADYSIEVDAPGAASYGLQGEHEPGSGQEEEEQEELEAEELKEHHGVELEVEGFDDDEEGVQSLEEAEPPPPPPQPSMPYYDEDEDADELELEEAPPAESNEYSYDSAASSRAATPLEPPPPPRPPPRPFFRPGAAPRASGSAAEGFAAALAAAQKLRAGGAAGAPHVPPPPRHVPPPQRTPLQPKPQQQQQQQKQQSPQRGTPARNPPPSVHRPQRQHAQQAVAPAAAAAGPAGAQMLSVEEEVFENQRAVPMLGWSSGYLVATDPHAWSNRDGSVGSRDEFPDAPLPRGWAWLGEWGVDSAPTARREADAEGWTYAIAFSRLLHPPGGELDAGGGEGADSPAMLVRRRRWVRTRGCLVSAAAAAPAPKPSLAHGGSGGGGIGARLSSGGWTPDAPVPGTAPLLSAPNAAAGWQPHRPAVEHVGAAGVGAAEAALSVESWDEERRRSSAASDRDRRAHAAAPPPVPGPDATQSDGGSSAPWRRSTAVTAAAAAPQPPPAPSYGGSSYGGAAPLAPVPARASPLLRAPGRASPAPSQGRGSPAPSLDAHGAVAGAEWQRRSAAAEAARLTAVAAVTAAHAAAAAAAAASRASTPQAGAGAGEATTKPPWRVAEEEIAAALTAPMRSTPPPPGTPSPPARAVSSTGEPAVSAERLPPQPLSPAKSVRSAAPSSMAGSKQPQQQQQAKQAGPPVPFGAAAKRRAALAASAAAAKVPLPGGMALAGPPGKAVDPSRSVFARSATLAAVMSRARTEYVRYQAATRSGGGGAGGGTGWRAALWGSTAAAEEQTSGTSGTKAPPPPAGVVAPAPRVRAGAPRVRPRPPLLYSAAAMLQPGARAASYAVRTAVLDLLGFGAAVALHAVRTYWLHCLVLVAAHVGLSYVV